ncbi:MAG: hypothetical protein Q9196_002012 [Gyalolechia fulgens]
MAILSATIGSRIKALRETLSSIQDVHCSAILNLRSWLSSSPCPPNLVFTGWSLDEEKLSAGRERTSASPATSPQKPQSTSTSSSSSTRAAKIIEAASSPSPRTTSPSPVVTATTTSIATITILAFLKPNRPHPAATVPCTIGFPTSATITILAKPTSTFTSSSPPSAYTSPPKLPNRGSGLSVRLALYCPLPSRNRDPLIERLVGRLPALVMTATKRRIQAPSDGKGAVGDPSGSSVRRQRTLGSLARDERGTRGALACACRVASAMERH